MARKLSPNTINKLKKKLLAEREQLVSMLEQHQQERENLRISEASAERSPDPTSADGGSMAFELEKELTLESGRTPFTHLSLSVDIYPIYLLSLSANIFAIYLPVISANIFPVYQPMTSQ